ncbi:MAG TPA: hypothetical protein VFC21_12045 [Bryobacteraceae bacterium]|nr:hypothetical protein [Bryobacteraceae bacterium]
MTITRGAQCTITATFCAVLGVVYAIAWRAPSFGLFHEDGTYLVAAESLATGHMPSVTSLFPVVLAFLTAISRSPLWLKLLPLLCTAAWLALAWRLLRRMGAKTGGAWLLILLTAASPTVIFLGTNLMSQPLFALLTTAALLMLLDDRALFAGLLAGLATITSSAGLPLVAACMSILVIRRSFRRAAFFTAGAMLFVAPWLGWMLAKGAGGSFTSLALSEKLSVLGSNALSLLASPFELLSGVSSMYAIVATALLLGWTLYRRRQLMPDLFLALYGLMLLCRVVPPRLMVAPILPLVFWILWRVFQHARIQEAVAAAALIAIAIPVFVDLARIPETLRLGEFPSSARIPDDWNQLQPMFGYIRAHAAPNAVVLANLDSMFYLNTGRKTVRGFFPDGYKLYYAVSRPVVTPDQLGKEIIANGVGYVALTPDRDLPGSSAYRSAVEALERGGMLEPVAVPGVSRDYRLLRVVSLKAV